MSGKVTFDEQVNILERFVKVIFPSHLQTLMALFPKSKVLKGQVLRSVEACGMEY